MDHSEHTLLRLRGLSVTYAPAKGATVCALDGVDLTLRPGQVLGILGESGSGKSTLANAILQILPRNAKFDSGEIIFGDSDLLRLTESQLQRIRGRQISMVSQDPALALNPVLTIGTQITEVLRAHLPLTPQQRRQKTLELLHEVDFDQPAAIYGAYPHQLSGGQRQRVVIAQAVACRPALLLADEPTSKLDASLQADMISLLARIRERHGTTILFISHDPALFTGFADRVAVMYAGRIVEAGQCSQIFRQPMHPYSQALLRIAKASTDLKFPIKTRFPKIEGEPPDLRHRHPEYSWSILRLFPGLEEASLYALHHHESVDGTGYPARLKGHDIPLVSRIISVIDAYDAMVSNRCYRKGLPHTEAIARLLRSSGTQFDPEVVRAFIPIAEKETAEVFEAAGTSTAAAL